MSEPNRPFMLKKEDGTVLIMRIIHPTNTPDDELLKWSEVQKEGIVGWAEVREEDLPQDRIFREAWKYTEENVVQEDLDLSKEIKLNEFRQLRVPLLDTLDVEMMRAIENGDDLELIKEKKQALRDVTDVELPTDIDELKGFIPDCLKEEL